MNTTTPANEFRRRLIDRFGRFQQESFANNAEVFDRPYTAGGGRPPVFLKSHAELNIIAHPHASPEERRRLLDLVPVNKRHRWFRSMTSSQALAQSVLGNLIVHDCVGLLGDLEDDEGQPLFGRAVLTADTLALEHEVGFLGEPTPTSLDGIISGAYRVAIECKLTEQEVGPCSRPLMKTDATRYEQDFCDGTYTVQRGRCHRCSLTDRGVKYWGYVPALFPDWVPDRDHRPCPLADNYQLVRNVLAACVREDGAVSPSNGHAVLLYDSRNPAFQPGGKGYVAFDATRSALIRAEGLRKCGWQSVTTRLADSTEMRWLAHALDAKYGFLSSGDSQ